MQGSISVMARSQAENFAGKRGPRLCESIFSIRHGAGRSDATHLVQCCTGNPVIFIEEKHQVPEDVFLQIHDTPGPSVGHHENDAAVTRCPCVAKAHLMLRHSVWLA